MCEVLSGVGDLVRQVFLVHCVSLSDANPHRFSFPFCRAKTKPGKDFIR